MTDPAAAQPVRLSEDEREALGHCPACGARVYEHPVIEPSSDEVMGGYCPLNGRLAHEAAVAEIARRRTASLEASARNTADDAERYFLAWQSARRRALAARAPQPDASAALAVLPQGETETTLAQAWDKGMRVGTSRAMRHMSDEPHLPLASDADNPYLRTEAPMPTDDTAAQEVEVERSRRCQYVTAANMQCLLATSEDHSAGHDVLGDLHDDPNWGWNRTWTWAQVERSRLVGLLYKYCTCGHRRGAHTRGPRHPGGSCCTPRCNCPVFTEAAR